MNSFIDPNQSLVEYSSGEDYIDLDLELSSDGSLCSFRSLSPNKWKKELKQNLKELDTKGTAEGSDQDECALKVVGQNDVGPTTQTRIISSAWMLNANHFPAKVCSDAESLSLASIGNLSTDFLPSLRGFIHFWFPVQRSVLPALLRPSTALPPRDLVICSPTGSGKTLCYVLPILNSLHLTSCSPSSVYALVIAPVKNLAEQILHEFEKLNVFGAKIGALLGQNEYQTERRLLFPNGSKTSKMHIIVATPGRFVEHLLDPTGLLDLRMLRYLVIDEADRMQDTARMEWLELVEKCAKVPRDNAMSISKLTNFTQNCWLQRILLSATLSLDINSLHTWNLRCPLLFQANKQHTSAGDVKQDQHKQMIRNSFSTESNIILPHSLSHKLIECELKFKPLLMCQQMELNCDEWKRVIVFVNKKQTAKILAVLLTQLLSKNAITVAEFSANLYKKRRKKLLNDFQAGKIRVLIACDVLSRGIDVLDVDCVINYDVPINERIFVHRAGRTARAMKEGVLLSLTNKKEKMRMKKLLTTNSLWDEIQLLKVTKEDLDSKMMRRYEKALLRLKQKIKQ